MADTLGDLRRLRRAREGKVLAGVCAGVGRQLGVDPVLLRVVLAVLTPFGGVGPLLYVAGWLLLPVEPNSSSLLESQVGRRRDGTPDRPLFVGAVVVLLAVIATMPWWGLSWHAPALLLLAVVGFVALLRHPPGATDRDGIGADASPPADAEAATDSVLRAGVPGAPEAAPGPMSPAQSATGGAPTTSWRNLEPAPASFWKQPDPLGLEDRPGAEDDTARLAAGDTVRLTAGDTARLPAGHAAPAGPQSPSLPSGRPVGPRPRRSHLFAGTLGVTALATLALGLLDSADRAMLPASAYLAAALGVVGLGLVVGTWFGRSRGLLVVGVLLALSLPPAAALERWPVQSIDRTFEPLRVEQIRPSYDYVAGRLALDLTEVRFAESDVVRTRVDLATGDLQVRVPRHVDVEIAADMGTGQLNVFGERAGGAGIEHRVVDLGADGRGGGKLELRIDVGAGEVGVRRG